MRGTQRWLVCNVYTALMYIHQCIYINVPSVTKLLFRNRIWLFERLFCKVINLLERVFPHYISHCPRLGRLFTTLDWVCVSDCSTSYYRYYRYCEFLARWWSTMMLLCAFCELGVNTLCIHMTLTHTKYTHSQRYFIVFYILRFLQY